MTKLMRYIWMEYEFLFASKSIGTGLRSTAQIVGLTEKYIAGEEVLQ